MSTRLPLRAALDVSRWFLVQQGSRLRRRVGIAGLIAMAGFTAAVAFAAWDRYLQHELRSVATQLAFQNHARSFDAQAVAMRPAPEDEDDAAQVRERLRSFDRGLPAFDEVGDSLNDILRGAERHNLKVVHGEYHTTSDETADFARYEMSLPVSGDPAAIQALLAETLRAQNFLAVEHLRVQRSMQSPGIVEAQIRWVLFVRKPTMAAAGVDTSAAASSPSSSRDVK